MKTIKIPLDLETVKSLRINDVFEITGKVYLARDAAHKKILEMHKRGEKFPNELSALLKDCPCYHCGPIVRRKNGEWKVVSAGPTTSTRMEIFEDEFMDKFRTKMFIGKGGMGERTLNALKKHGGVYAEFTGGAGSLAAEAFKRVENVFFLDELGIPEAIWVFEVEKFGPLVVTMDSQGSSLYLELSRRVKENLERVKSRL